MRLLVVTSNYPFAGNPLSGIFNERTVGELGKQCNDVVVLCPRPYVPPLSSRFVTRWAEYEKISQYEIRKGVEIYRPPYLQLPGPAGALVADYLPFLFISRLAKSLHERERFDAILGFDLSGTAVMTWRVGRKLGLPKAAWITGRFPSSLSYQRAIAKALRQLDVVFYQSQETLNLAAALLGVNAIQLTQKNHFVLPRGIPEPPLLQRDDVGKRMRTVLGVQDDHLLVLTVSRVCREKGIFELLDGVSRAARFNPNIRLVIVGSNKAFDETTVVQQHIDEDPTLKKMVRLVPACDPAQVWEYLCAADLFAFTSHHEGMPNSLLEAMAMGVPAIAFAIPSVLEIEAGTGAICLVPPFDRSLYSQGLLHLAASPADRARIGETGRHQVASRFMAKSNVRLALERLTCVIREPVPVRVEASDASTI
jgi:teichuronic acid biosynthesis glycosyltransferase TuaC